MSARRPLALALAAGAVLATGCGAAEGSDVQDAEFREPARQAVAAAVRDFSDATGDRDYEQICADYLAAPLVKRLDDAKGTDRCPDQIERSLRDVSETELAIREVRISGENAVAVVQPTGTGEVEAQARFTLVREGPRWKLSGIG
ncbi:MAG: nuclear transport factor 2 family protein [Solirubrobacterales bacterium]|nr:nuclear transport factor 2 family protein [Solirubrobacterales bacterium]